MKKRVFAVFLVLSMAAALLPLSVMAEEVGTAPAEQCTCDVVGHKYNREAPTGQCTCCGASCDHANNTKTTSCAEGTTCSVCGASEKMDLVGPNSGIAGLLDSDPQEIEVVVEAADEAVKENVEVKGTVLPNGGTAYVIRETVTADGEAAESISLRSENEDICYVGYQRTDEKGVATETLELNAAKGVASVDILRGELEDGTKKAVESLTAEDICLVFDHESGSFTTAGILFLENDGVREYTVVNLEFSDGSETALVYEHGYFDLDEMRYVFLTAENAEDYLGHRFYKAEIVDGVYTPAEATLVGVTVTEEVVASYDFPTKYHLNFFADGFLSMPAETEGLTNFFAYDDDLGYNAESMTAAIAQYGLPEYADLAAWLTEEEFVSYPAQYLAVNYGNGTLTQEALIELIETYVHEYR